MIEQRDIILVPFPFSDQSSRKVRPGIVISNNEFNKNSEDVLIVGVTSNLSKGIYTLSLTSEDLDEGKLFTKCCIKSENLLKIDKDLIVKKIGVINKNTFTKIIKLILKIIN